MTDRTKDNYSHIRYTWGGCSLTLHKLDNKLAMHGIPETASRAFMRYFYDTNDVLVWKEVPA